MQPQSDSLEAIGVIAFYGFFLLLSIVYAFAAVRREKEVAAKLSEKPNLQKKHALLEALVLPRAAADIWPYLTQPELYKKWHPYLRGITALQGEVFKPGSEMLFQYTENNSLRVMVIAREEDQYIGLCRSEATFDRYEWFILEAVTPTSTKLTVVNDHQFRSGGRWLTASLWLHISTNAHRRSVQNNLKALQAVLAF